MSRRRQRVVSAARTRRVLVEAIQHVKDCRAAGVEPLSRLDTAIDRAAEERAWRAVWSTP